MAEAATGWEDQPKIFDQQQQQKKQEQEQEQVPQQTQELHQDDFQHHLPSNVNDLGLGDDDDDDILDEMEDTQTNQDGSDNNNNTTAHNPYSPLLMRFCPHDSSMLYPREDRRTRTLRYACGLRSCRYSEETHTSMVYQNVLTHEMGNVLHKVLSAVSDDPSLPRTQNESCESCGYNEAVFFQSDTSDVRNDTLALIFVCCSCGHKWVK